MGYMSIKETNRYVHTIKLKTQQSITENLDIPSFTKGGSRYPAFLPGSQEFLEE